MDGLFFLMSIVGIGLVLWWMVQNDKTAVDKPTKGLFAMQARTRLKTKPFDGRNPAAERPSAEPPAAVVTPLRQIWPR